ncbi:nitroreductase family protein [Candidatus Aminicenantes bacterium AC-334-K16]|jgi:nitroreductase|nr:nitroreductase family protein [Candidatus Aminicenantes bacterium AC-334-K16]
MKIDRTPMPYLLKLIWQRRSIRRFLDKPVSREKLLLCLEAARWAPSAENVQPWRFLVIDDQETKKKFAEKVFSGIYFPSRFAQQAPVLILVLARLDLLANRLGKQIQGVSYYLLDIGMAGEHLVLQAEELGLSTCWVGWFNLKKARKFFSIPRKYKIISLIAVGYAAKRPPRAPRKKRLSEIVWFNQVERSSPEVSDFELNFHPDESLESEPKGNSQNEVDDYPMDG